MTIRKRMKKWLGSIALVLVGLMAGYLLFSGIPGSDRIDDPHHVHSEDCDHGDAHSQAGGENQVEYWTCSMHPAVRSDEPGSCPICGMDLIPVQSDEREGGDYSMVMTEAAVMLSRIRTTPAIYGQPEKTVRLPGRIEVDERRIATVTAHFPGRIRELRIGYTGAPIKKGEAMATIYSPELVTAQRELIEALRREDRFPGMVESAREKLRRWELTDRQIQEIEERGEVKTDLEILSPVDGFVLARNVSREQHVAEGTILFEVADLEHVWAVFDAYEEDVEWLSVGDTIDFQLRALPGTAHHAEINYIDPVADPVRRTVRVRADIENPERRLRPEMLVRGQISARMREDAVMVPASAVLWTGPRSIVFVLEMDEAAYRFEAREVTLGDRAGDFLVVREGLREGEEVVFHGAFRVDSEFQLADRFSMMNRQVVVASGITDAPDGYDPHAGDHPPEDLRDGVDAGFRGEFTRLVHQYINIKKALVASDPVETVSKTGNFISVLESIGEHRLQGEAHMAWMDYYRNLRTHARMLADGEDLGQMRREFHFLSRLLIEAAISLGTDDRFYHQFCPMAFDDHGGDWISDDSVISNPYLPETMLRCGEVRRELHVDM